LVEKTPVEWEGGSADFTFSAYVTPQESFKHGTIFAHVIDDGEKTCLPARQPDDTDYGEETKDLGSYGLTTTRRWPAVGHDNQ
jgi:hypothetical protein